MLQYRKGHNHTEILGILKDYGFSGFPRPDFSRLKPLLALGIKQWHKLHPLGYLGVRTPDKHFQYILLFKSPCGLEADKSACPLAS